MTPERTRAVLVGIEEYAAGAKWRLDGPALDACRFARWLAYRGVPQDRIHLLLAPLARNRTEVDAFGFGYDGADSATVERVLYEASRAADDELLFVYWGGHGVVERDDSRRVFYADAETDNRRNLDIDAYLRSLRTDYFPQPHQILVIDTCQTFLASPRVLPHSTPPLGRQLARRRQHVLFAAGPGGQADNLNARRTGVFSEMVLQELAAQPTGWPPNADLLSRQVGERFARLRANGHTQQHPYTWYRGPDGERPLLAAGPPPVPAGVQLGIADLREISLALLAIDELLDPAIRRSVLLYLPRHIAVSMQTADDANQQVQHWIRNCARFVGGREALVAALEMLVPTGSAEYARAAATIDERWPDVLA